MNWGMLTDGEMIREMERRGYVVRHKTEVRIPLTWNRTAPFPDGVDFKAEAVEKIGAQLTPDMLEFTTRDGGWPSVDIHTAKLRIL